jgi:hypothetical protein
MVAINLATIPFPFKLHLIIPSKASLDKSTIIINKAYSNNFMTISTPSYRPLPFFFTFKSPLLVLLVEVE